MSPPRPRARQGQPLPLRRHPARGRAAPARLRRPGALARRRAHARARGARRGHLPRRRGPEPRRPRAASCSASTPGWDGPPQRLTIDKRIPVAAGMGGGSSDAAATLRLAAHAAGLPVPAELGPRLGADVPSLLRPGRVLMTGAGEHVARLPDPEPLGVLVLPADAALSTPDVYREADRLGLTRPHAALERRRHARRSTTTSRTPPARSAPRSTPRSTPPARPAPTTRSSPAPGRPSSACSSARTARPARGRRSAPGRARSPPSPSARSGRPSPLMHPFPLAGAIGLAVFLVVRRRHLGRATLAVGAVVVAALALWGFGVVEPPNLTKLIEDVGNQARQVDLPARRRARLPRDRRVRRARRARRERDPDRRRRRRPGPDLDLRPDRHRLGLRRRRRPHLLHARPPARPRLPRAPRPAAEDHRGAAALRRGLLRPPRRDHDPDRALHRARPRDRAVHRGRLEDAAAHVPPLRHPRRRAVGVAVLPARLLLLAVAGQGRGLHRQGRRRVQRASS